MRGSIWSGEHIYADLSMQGNIRATGSVGDFWIKGGASLFHPLSSPTMPPRSAKGKAPAKATVASTAAVATSTASSTHLPSSGDLAGQFFDLDSNLLAAKSDLPHWLLVLSASVP